ncbi:hypothetical protein D3C81_1820110 [compost metagenome]
MLTKDCGDLLKRRQVLLIDSLPQITEVMLLSGLMSAAGKDSWRLYISEALERGVPTVHPTGLLPGILEFQINLPG